MEAVLQGCLSEKLYLQVDDGSIPQVVEFPWFVVDHFHDHSPFSSSISQTLRSVSCDHRRRSCIGGQVD